MLSGLLNGRVFPPTYTADNSDDAALLSIIALDSNKFLAMLIVPFLYTSEN
jgi:hypothetical protein